jgi:hypothetical protein
MWTPPVHPITWLLLWFGGGEFAADCLGKVQSAL